MKKLIVLLFVALIPFLACKKDLDEYNVNTKNADSAPSRALFTTGQKALVDWVTSPNVNTNIFRLITQQWTEVTYVDESNYDLGTRSVPDNWWRSIYKLTLVNLRAAKNAIPNEGFEPREEKNKLAMVDILEVYAWSLLINTFGDIPYTEALDADNFFPKYDDAQTVYNDLLARLDAAIDNLDPAEEGFGNADLIYGGDIDKWIKFANSLKLRMAITIVDVDEPRARTLIEEAAPLAFTSNDDNATLVYLGAAPNTNPVYVDLVQGGRNDFVPATTIINLMNDLNDPRRPLYFTTINGEYKGGTPGIGNAYATLSHVSDAMKEPEAPASLIDYAEVEFILAEASARGFSVPGTAESHYNEGISASILDWGGTTANATTYLAQADVNYATAPGTYKQKIGIQKYIAMYNRGFDAWVEQRRLDAPVIIAPPTAISAYPVRFSYPASEQNLNGGSYSAAVTAMGGQDKVDTKLFWDVF